MPKRGAKFRRNRLIIGTASVLPLIFLIIPTASILSVKASALSAGLGKGIDRSLFLPLIVPVLVPSMMSGRAWSRDLASARGHVDRGAGDGEPWSG